MVIIQQNTNTRIAHAFFSRLAVARSMVPPSPETIFILAPIVSMSSLMLRKPMPRAGCRAICLVSKPWTSSFTVSVSGRQGFVNADRSKLHGHAGFAGQVIERGRQAEVVEQCRTQVMRNPPYLSEHV